MEALTLDRAKALAAEVVAEFGEDYIYPEDHKRVFPGNDEAGCVYVHDEKPSCLVAQILHRYGVSVEELSKLENKGAYTVAEETTSCGDYVPSYLSGLQRRQDEGQTWGMALKLANQNYPN